MKKPKELINYNPSRIFTAPRENKSS